MRVPSRQSLVRDPPAPDAGGALRRYHELDGLRGAMMLLGVALHAAVAYLQTPLGDLWPFKDPHTHPGFDALVALLHTFRMPVFFALAGFFGALLHEQRGGRHMVRNRAQRVLVPLVVGWIVLFPLSVAGFAFAQMGGTLDAAGRAVRYAASTAAFADLQLLHLWFLSDLLLYYAVALLACRLARLVPEAGRRVAVDGFGRLLRHWYAPLALAVPTLLTLIPMRSGMLETPGTFLRPPASIAAHGVFFAFGWMLYLRRDLLPGMTTRAWGLTLAGLGLFPVHALAVVHLAALPSRAVHTAAITSLAATIWLFVFGLIGLSTRYLTHPRPVLRYLADASYWFYLAHLPLVAWGAGLLGTLSWPAGIKYVTLLTAVLATCGITYDLAVRPTALGALLNGRRYPRGLPLLVRSGAWRAGRRNGDATAASSGPDSGASPVGRVGRPADVQP